MKAKILSTILASLLLAGCGKGVATAQKNAGNGGGNGSNTTFQPPEVTLLSDLTTVNYNQSVVFAWDVPTASQCDLKDSKGAILASATTGNFSVASQKYPAAGAYQTFYSLECTYQGLTYQSKRNISVNEVVDHLIFVTSTPHDGDFGGTAGANAICQSAATNAGLRPGKVWAAAISSSGKNIHNRMNLTMPLRNMMGEVVYADPTQFYDNARTNPTNAVKYTETGMLLSPAAALDVWTGTNTDGGNNTDCSNWTRNDNGNQGQVGYSSSNTATWTNGKNNEGCAATHSLYCISFPAGTVINN